MLQNTAASYLNGLMPRTDSYMVACLQGYWYSPGWQKYHQSLEAKSKTPLFPALVPEAAATALLAGVPDTTIKARAASATPDSIAANSGQGVVSSGSAADSSCGVTGSTISLSAVPVVLAYATVSHNTERYAEAITKVLEGSGRVKVRPHNLVL
jgi:hypothetical protein